VHRRHLLSALAGVGLPVLAGSPAALATVVQVVAGVPQRDEPDEPDERDDHDDHDEADDACERVTTTGRATVRRRCDGTRTEASVDNRMTVSDPRAVRTTHERPIDRLRSRGEGRIHATGDKGARRELREKARRGN
jgi:hypothetical protein